MSELALEELAAIAAIYCGKDECEVLQVSGDCFAAAARSAGLLDAGSFSIDLSNRDSGARNSSGAFL